MPALFFVVLVPLAGGCVLIERTPARAVAGEGTLGIRAEAPQRDTVRVATFNIWAGQGTDGLKDLDRTASVLRSFDLIALQEVEAPLLLRRGNNARELGRRLEMPWIFAPTEEWFASEHFGNALLTTLPVRHWQSIPLHSTQTRGHRNVIFAQVEHQGETITLLATHLDRRRDRIPQLRSVSELFLSFQPPVVLMGDLNSDREDPLIQNMLQSPGVRAPLMEIDPDIRPDRVDWILTRGLRTIDAGLVDEGASDHPMIWAELVIER